MSPSMRAFSREMIVSLIVVALAVMVFRPHASDSSPIQSLAFSIVLIAGQALAIRALRHLLPSRLVRGS